MTGYLATIVGRLGHGAPAVRPRLPARFEAPGSSPAFSVSDVMADPGEPPGSHEPDAPARPSAGPSAGNERSAPGALRESRPPPPPRAPPPRGPSSEPPSLGRIHPREADTVPEAGALEAIAPVARPTGPSARWDAQETARPTPSVREGAPPAPSPRSPPQPAVQPPALEGVRPPAAARPVAPAVPGRRARTAPSAPEAPDESSTDAASFDLASVSFRRVLGVRATTEREPARPPAEHPGPSGPGRRSAEPPTVASAAAPTIEVTIGRIEVRAAPAPAPARAGPAVAPATPVMTLEQYLQRRAGGAGR